jgi:hypothetical protein
MFARPKNHNIACPEHSLDTPVLTWLYGKCSHGIDAFLSRKPQLLWTDYRGEEKTVHVQFDYHI